MTLHDETIATRISPCEIVQACKSALCECSLTRNDNEQKRRRAWPGTVASNGSSLSTMLLFDERSFHSPYNLLPRRTISTCSKSRLIQSSLNLAHGMMSTTSNESPSPSLPSLPLLSLPRNDPCRLLFGRSPR